MFYFAQNLRQVSKQWPLITPLKIKSIFTVHKHKSRYNFERCERHFGFLFLYLKANGKRCFGSHRYDNTHLLAKQS